MDLEQAIFVIGRALLGGLFLYAGVRHFFIADAIVPALQARGVPAPRLSLYVASGIEAALGALLVMGLFVAFAALGLAAFVIVATVTLVNFWDKTGAEREALLIPFTNNVAILGGLLIAASTAL